METKTLRIQLSASDGKAGNYIRALEAAGAEPVGGYCPEPDLSCDGLLLCGGGDADPRLYGAENQGSQPPDPARDRAEEKLFRDYLAAGKPILGICRGMQMINIFLGGTLIQDLPGHSATEQGDTVHPVRAAEGSFLHRLFGPEYRINSSHHQAVDIPGEGLRLCAWSPEGIPEGMEHESLPIFGVQYHPERLSYGMRRPDADPGEAIFEMFLNLCGR